MRCHFAKDSVKRYNIFNRTALKPINFIAGAPCCTVFPIVPIKKYLWDSCWRIFVDYFAAVIVYESKHAPLSLQTEIDVADF